MTYIIHYELCCKTFDDIDEYLTVCNFILDAGNSQQKKDFLRLNIEQIREYAKEHDPKIDELIGKIRSIRNVDFSA